MRRTGGEAEICSTFACPAERSPDSARTLGKPPRRLCPLRNSAAAGWGLADRATIAACGVAR